MTAAYRCNLAAAGRRSCAGLPTPASHGSLDKSLCCVHYGRNRIHPVGRARSAAVLYRIKGISLATPACSFGLSLAGARAEPHADQDSHNPRAERLSRPPRLGACRRRVARHPSEAPHETPCGPQVDFRKAIRACAISHDLGRALGITFVLSAGRGAVAGAPVAPIQYNTPNGTLAAAVNGLVAAALGGPGNFTGTVLRWLAVWRTRGARAHTYLFRLGRRRSSSSCGFV